MKNIFILILCVLFTQTTIGQTVGKIKAETYQAEFEKKKSIDDVSDYWGTNDTNCSNQYLCI